jgi:7-carboxy-7-deazaguanine synthase
VRVAEIFRSIQGEGRQGGLPCTFVRVAGCPQRCRWCDTAYALKGSSGERLSSADIVERCRSLGLDFVLITGGEPLAHPETPALARALLQAGASEVAVETSGAFPIEVLPVDVRRIMDWKCPDSGEAHRNRIENVEHLRPEDDIKFVVASRADFEWAVAEISAHRMLERCAVFLSAVAQVPEDAPGGPDQPTLEHGTLAHWILDAGLALRQQVQLHRILWPDRHRGV